ncbi:MAG: hypothetical protein E3J90_13985 [Promethearchaeota archaeon]|nr:MAG: hypothetical protein E3J90_13985 [Candidatus Lokiarchaeota archaeon]
MRVLNNYYYKKAKIEKKLKPLARKRFKDELKNIEQDGDWLHTVPLAINSLSDDLIVVKDSFKFPDSIILFEAWMNLGFGALFPRLALHYKFPGFLKGEKTRNVFQFTYSTSRGFGFPIYFGPEFYGYMLTIGKLLEPLFKWSHTICHRANQVIYLVGKKYDIKRHHPGEFESVIISEYNDNVFKGIDTLLHGYYTQDPKTLGVFSSLENALDNVTFSYSVGDHAMSAEREKSKKTISVPLITHDTIVRKYNVNFYDYLNDLIATEKLIKRKIIHFKQLRKEFISNLKRIDRIKFRIDQSKSFSVPSLKISQKFSQIQECSLHVRLMEIIIKMLWTTPLYTHTIHKTIDNEVNLQKQKRNDIIADFSKKSIDSIFLLYIKKFEEKNSFSFKEMDVINELVNLKDKIGTMWLNFKEKHFNFALKKLNDLSTLSLDDISYRKVVNEHIDNLIPIFSIYEIFNRALSESVYPESVPQTKRLGGYLASILTSRFNPFGVNLMNLFNKLAFNNWSYLIINRKLNRKQFFKLIMKLPIWKNIPKTIKNEILNSNF